MPRAIIIVDHGSRKDEANRMLERVADQVREQTSDRVYAAHMELAEPSLVASFALAVREGATEIFVFPFFLSPGRHSREDIPRMCAEAADGHPEVRWHCSGPIGLDPMLARLILERVSHCEAQGFQCDACPDASWCRPSPGSDD